MKDFMMRVLNENFALFMPTTPKGFKGCDVKDDGTMTLSKTPKFRGQTQDVYIIDDYAEFNTGQ